MEVVGFALVREVPRTRFARARPETSGLTAQEGDALTGVRWYSLHYVPVEREPQPAPSSLRSSGRALSLFRYATPTSTALRAALAPLVRLPLRIARQSDATLR